MSDRVLTRVEKPGRYAGGEWNSVGKDAAAVRARVVLAFPDVYEIGMSYPGQKILYAAANARPDIQAERVFAPWPDMERALRAENAPLRSLERQAPLADFDVIAFSLLYELNDTNILTMLELGGVPIEARNRRDGQPLVVAGGPAAFNPEPLAGVFDAFFIGDGEEGLLEIIDAWTSGEKAGASREKKLARLAGISGLYVPSLYDPFRTSGSPLLAVRPRPGFGAPPVIRKRILESWSGAADPIRVVVPNLQAVFDRVAVEVARGCPQKCRFCQATSLYAPYRVKDPGRIVETVRRTLDATGYEDASLFGLSVGDYPRLGGVVSELMAELGPRKVSLSLSSLRPKRLSGGIMESIIKVRKTGFTLVPEAATERLRRVINKSVEDRELWEAADGAFRRGWKLLKLYFMIGLPTETEADVSAIAGLVGELAARGRAVLGGPPRIHVSLSSFIPKPHTPFQWLGMDPPEALEEKQRRVRSDLRREHSVEVKSHDVRQSTWEAVFSRGDRRLHDVLLQAWSAGARFDGWKEHFRPDLWDAAMFQAGLDPRVYLGPLDQDAPLPWDHISSGMTKEFLRSELRAASSESFTPACTERACGTCRGCEYWAAPKSGWTSVPEELTAPRPAESGSLQDRLVHRYGVVYAKTGRLRFIGHNDLAALLQRVLRRAGIAVGHSEGFHPKILLSFGPALPLGMEGRGEFFEFKALQAYDGRDFLAAANPAAPPGLEFLSLAAILPGAPGFMDRIRGAVYSLDLRAEDVGAAAFAAYRETFGREPESTGEAVLRLLSAPEIGAEFGSWFLGSELDPSAGRIRLRAAITAQKIPRPQDLVRRALRFEKATYHMTREKFSWAEIDGANGNTV